ncbi:MAG: sugar phosphate isomerase/epimerase family protein [bacterium]|jgi:sugar phosphate isomerase/epimerase
MPSEAQPLGISTAWNAASLRDGEKVIGEILRVGFRSIEVDYRLSENAVPLLKQYIREGRLTVSSVHNFAPLPRGEDPKNTGGDKLSLASTDEAERQDAVALTRTTIDLARDLGARAVVLHIGHVEVGIRYFQEISDICRVEGVNSKKAMQMRDMVRKMRKDLRPPHMDSVTRSLKELVAYVGEDDLTLCIENRYFFHQIPLPVEVLFLIDEISSDRLKYWHDIGHAHVLEVQGWLPHLPALDTLKQHLFGVHIHDSVFTGDHIAPGTGEIDFEPIFRRVPPGAIKVMELSPKVSEDEVLNSIDFLSKFGLKP